MKEVRDMFLERVKSESSKRSFTNSMTTRSAFKILWRPNNYRRQVTVKDDLNSIGKSTIAKSLDFAQVNGHTNILSVKNYYPNITLQLGRNKLTAIWSQALIGGEKEVFLVEGENYHELQSFIDSKKLWIEDCLDKALKHFVEKFKYFTVGSPVWTRHEDWLKGEEYIDKLPRDCIIHDTVFKKVYAEGIEAIGGYGDEPTVKIKNYIKARMSEDIDDFRQTKIDLIDMILALPPHKFFKLLDSYSDN